MSTGPRTEAPVVLLKTWKPSLTICTYWVGADLAVGIGRGAVAADAGEGDAVEVEDRRGHVRLRHRALDDRVPPVGAQLGRARVRASLVLLPRSPRALRHGGQRQREIVLVRVADDRAGCRALASEGSFAARRERRRGRSRSPVDRTALGEPDGVERGAACEHHARLDGEDRKRDPKDEHLALLDEDPFE